MKHFLTYKQAVIIGFGCGVCLGAFLTTMYLAPRFDVRAEEEAFLRPSDVDPTNGKVYFGSGAAKYTKESSKPNDSE